MSKKKSAPSKTPVLRDSTGRWQKGTPPPNPQGRPKDGESWASVIKTITNATTEELAEMVGGKQTEMGRAFLQMPKGVQVKYLMTMRAVAGFMFEPNNALWQSIMERVDGKVKDQVEHSGEVKIDGFTDLLGKVYGADRDNPGT